MGEWWREAQQLCAWLTIQLSDKSHLKPDTMLTSGARTQFQLRWDEIFKPQNKLIIKTLRPRPKRNAPWCFLSIASSSCLLLVICKERVEKGALNHMRGGIPTCPSVTWKLDTVLERRKWNGSLEGLRNEWFCTCGVANYGIQPLSCLVVLWSLNLIPSHNISMLDGICMKQGDATSDIALWRSKTLSCHFSFIAFTSPGKISLSHPMKYIKNMASWHLQPKRCESTWKYIFSPCHIFDHCSYKLFLEFTFRGSSAPDSCW